MRPEYSLTLVQAEMCWGSLRYPIIRSWGTRSVWTLGLPAVEALVCPARLLTRSPAGSDPVWRRAFRVYWVASRDLDLRHPERKTLPQICFVLCVCVVFWASHHCDCPPAASVQLEPEDTQPTLPDIPSLHIIFICFFCVCLHQQMYCRSDLTLLGMNVILDWIFSVNDFICITLSNDTKHYACYQKTLKWAYILCNVLFFISCSSSGFAFWYVLC